MIKLLLLGDDIIYIAIIVGLGLYALSLRRRIKALDDPVLMLPRKERRAWARDELAQRKQDHDLAQFQRNLDIVQGKDKQ